MEAAGGVRFLNPIEAAEIMRGDLLGGGVHVDRLEAGATRRREERNRQIGSEGGGDGGGFLFVFGAHGEVTKPQAREGVKNNLIYSLPPALPLPFPCLSPSGGGACACA